MTKQAFFSLTPEEFLVLAKTYPCGRDASLRLMSKLYREKEYHIPSMSDEMSTDSLKHLKEKLHFNKPIISKVHKSVDGTVKFLIKFADGLEAEMVAMKFHKRYTLCLSSQVGCAMKCSFCFTGTQGLSRNLLSDEIVGQYLLGKEYLSNEGAKLLPNIVFMGQGEPLHNFDNLKKAIEVMTSVPGLKLGPKQITISTVGYLPGLKRFNELPPVHLALSLHNPFNDERNDLIPTNKRFDLDELMIVLKELGLHKRKRINIEYLLLKGVNDSFEHAQKIFEYASQVPFYVNIIPFNPYPGALYERPSDEDVERFKSYLVKYKIRTMVRTTRGDDILAACGQLANQ